MAASQTGKKLSRQHEGQARWAYLLAENHADRLLYVSGLGWHWYDGTRWSEDPDKVHAKRAVLDLLRQVRSAVEIDQDMLREIAVMQKASAVNGVLDLASILPEFHVTVEDLDADPYLLNVANGTLDLHECTLRPHSPADRITKVTRAAYDPDAGSASWDAFLASSLPKLPVRAFLQRYVGLALVGRVVEHILAIGIGRGANGKSVFIKAVDYALGDYAGTPSPELFNRAEGTHSAPEMALMGKRWVAVSETGEGASLSVATTKRLVGGDSITARRLYGNEVTFAPTHTAMLITNHLPKVRGDDPAIWRRLRVIPFEVVIPEKDRKSDLDERLEAEADAILLWALQGLDAYDTTGLDAPEEVLAATNSYRKREDAVEQFLEQVCEKGSDFKVTLMSLNLHWTQWAKANDQPGLTKPEFVAALRQRGYEVRRGTASKVFVHGLNLAGG